MVSLTQFINKIKPRHKHRVITMGYAVAIVFAFVLSLSNNNDVNASVSTTDRTDYLLLENTISEGFDEPETLYPTERILNIKSLFDMVSSYQREKEIEKHFHLYADRGRHFLRRRT